MHFWPQSVTIGQLDTVGAWLPRNELESLRADGAESHRNDRVAPAPQVVVLGGQVLAPGKHAPGAIRALPTEPGTDQRVTADLQRPAHSTVVEQADAILVDRIGVLKAPGARVCVQDEVAEGERNAIVDRGTEVPSWCELQPVARAILVQAQGIAVWKLEVLGIEQTAADTQCQVLDRSHIHFELDGCKGAAYTTDPPYSVDQDYAVLTAGSLAYKSTVVFDIYTPDFSQAAENFKVESYRNPANGSCVDISSTSIRARPVKRTLSGLAFLNAIELRY